MSINQLINDWLMAKGKKRVFYEIKNHYSMEKGKNFSLGSKKLLSKKSRKTSHWKSEKLLYRIYEKLLFEIENENFSTKISKISFYSHN